MTMNKPQYVPTISLGNALTMIVLFATLVGNYAVTRHQVTTLEGRIEGIQRETSERTTRFELIAQSYESRIRATEIAQASQTSDLRAIQAGIDEIKEQLRVMRSNARVGNTP